jgi:hypothetical protein
MRGLLSLAERSYMSSGITSPGVHVGTSIPSMMEGGWGVRLGMSEADQVMAQASCTRRVLLVASVPVMVAASGPESEFSLEVQRPQPWLIFPQTRSSCSKPR